MPQNLFAEAVELKALEITHGYANSNMGAVRTSVGSALPYVRGLTKLFSYDPVALKEPEYTGEWTQTKIAFAKEVFTFFQTTCKKNLSAEELKHFLLEKLKEFQDALPNLYQKKRAEVAERENITFPDKEYTPGSLDRILKFLIIFINETHKEFQGYPHLGTPVNQKTDIDRRQDPWLETRLNLLTYLVANEIDRKHEGLYEKVHAILPIIGKKRHQLQNIKLALEKAKIVREHLSKIDDEALAAPTAPGNLPAVQHFTDSILATHKLELELYRPWEVPVSLWGWEVCKLPLTIFSPTAGKLGAQLDKNSHQTMRRYVSSHKQTVGEHRQYSAPYQSPLPSSVHSPMTSPPHTTPLRAVRQESREFEPPVLNTIQADRQHEHHGDEGLEPHHQPDVYTDAPDGQDSLLTALAFMTNGSGREGLDGDEIRRERRSSLKFK